MVIVKILGGFASQLRHYGVGYLLAKSKYTDLYLDLSDYVDGYFRPFMLSFVSLPDCFILQDRTILNRAVNVRNGKILTELFEESNFPDVYLGGETADYADFFEKYPMQYPGENFELLKSLHFVYDSPFLEHFKSEIEKFPGVGVHVRLGDFDELGVADNISKYKAAIGWILSKKPDYKVYFFSNDIIRAIELFGNNSNFRFIDYQNGYLGDVEEFFALSMCQEKIIATRSGYSRYAAYLGTKQFGSNNAICLEDFENLTEEFTFLNAIQMREGFEYYSKQCTISSVEAIFIGKEYTPEIRYDTVSWNSVLSNEQSKQAFWREFYHLVDNSSDSASLVLWSLKKYNRWYFNGLYLRALIYARLGRRVLYICKKGNDSFGMKVNEITPTKDMDGRDLGFDILILEGKTNFKLINANWCGDEKIVFLKDSLRDILFGLFKKISSHQFKDNCLYLPKKLSDFKNNPYYINNMIEKLIISKD